MKEKDRELLELRHKTLVLIDELQFILQFSWRIKKIKDSYDIDSRRVRDIEMLHHELMLAYNEFWNTLGDKYGDMDNPSIGIFPQRKGVFDD